MDTQEDSGIWSASRDLEEARSMMRAAAAVEGAEQAGPNRRLDSLVPRRRN